MTLLEIMIVLALIALIAGTIGMGLMRRYQEGQLRAARIQVRELSANVQHFLIAQNRCPSLEDLVAARFVRSPPRDPWGNSVAIRCPGEHDPEGVDVVSFGPDHQEGTTDDITSWSP